MAPSHLPPNPTTHTSLTSSQGRGHLVPVSDTYREVLIKGYVQKLPCLNPSGRKITSREGKLLVQGHTTRKPESQGIPTPWLSRGDCAPHEGRGEADGQLCPQVSGAAGAHRS